MNKKSGITLIALIITIIIMLILVAVSVSILINSGLIGKAKEGAQKTKTAYEQEQRIGESINIDGVMYNSIDEYINRKKGKYLGMMSLECIEDGEELYVYPHFENYLDYSEWLDEVYINRLPSNENELYDFLTETMINSYSIHMELDNSTFQDVVNTLFDWGDIESSSYTSLQDLYENEMSSIYNSCADFLKDYMFLGYDEWWKTYDVDIIITFDGQTVTTNLTEGAGEACFDVFHSGELEVTATASNGSSASDTVTIEKFLYLYGEEDGYGATNVFHLEAFGQIVSIIPEFNPVVTIDATGETIAIDNPSAFQSYQFIHDHEGILQESLSGWTTLYITDVYEYYDWDVPLMNATVTLDIDGEIVEWKGIIGGNGG